MQCKICGSYYDTVLTLLGHVRKAHKITSKSYYDSFFKKR